MRLWSLHPAYLDARGLVACWREGLLARAVLKGETKGYRHHPQLERFKAHADPVAVLDLYLLALWEEADQRGYAFDRQKIAPGVAGIKLSVTDGQLAYEWAHLKAKLQTRDGAHYKKIINVVAPLPHPLFVVCKGDIEPWERGTGNGYGIPDMGYRYP